MNPCVTLFYTMLCFGIKFLSNVYFHLKYMSTVKIIHVLMSCLLGCYCCQGLCSVMSSFCENKASGEMKSEFVCTSYFI